MPFSEKATFQIIFGQKCENKADKKPEGKTKVDFLLQRAKFYLKSQLVKVGLKSKKK